jgi:ribosomal protein S18 acetylase RimI-like enzyme
MIKKLKLAITTFIVVFIIDQVVKYGFANLAWDVDGPYMSLKNLRKQMEEEGHIYYIAYKDGEVAGYVSIQPEGEHLFHLQKIYVLPLFQGCRLGKALFEQAVKAIKEIHPGPCEMHLNVNRNNKALQFYQHLGMEKVAEGDFHIGNGYYMNDYIMGLKI